MIDDLVLTDIYMYMPEKDEIELLVAIKQTRPQTKLICMSGASARGLLNLNPEAEILGVDRTLSKPFDQETLLSTINDVLSKNGVPRAGRHDTTKGHIEPNARRPSNVGSSHV